MRGLLFVLIGVLALAAAILILIYLAQWIILFVAGGRFFAATFLGIIFFCVMFLINYLVNNYHGELS